MSSSMGDSIVKLLLVRLKDAGLRTSGRKSVLVDRLMEAQISPDDEVPISIGPASPSILSRVLAQKVTCSGLSERSIKIADLQMKRNS